MTHVDTQQTLGVDASGETDEPCAVGRVGRAMTIGELQSVSVPLDDAAGVVRHVGLERVPSRAGHVLHDDVLPLLVGIREDQRTVLLLDHSQIDERYGMAYAAFWERLAERLGAEIGS